MLNSTEIEKDFFAKEVVAEKMIAKTLSQIDGITKTQLNFLVRYFTSLTRFLGRANMKNLNRHGAPDPKTQGEWHKHFWDWSTINLQIFENYKQEEEDKKEIPFAIAIDATFIKKSGKHTSNIGHFWNSIQGKVDKGIEISTLAFISKGVPNAHAFNNVQTPAKTQDKNKNDQTRTQFYFEHFKQNCSKLPSNVQYLVGDNAYANKTFINGLNDLNKTRAEGEFFYLISRLKKNANLRYFYMDENPQKKRKKGKKKTFDGKVYFKDFSKWDSISLNDDKLEAYTLVVNHKHWKQKIRVLVFFPKGKPEQRKIFFSTDFNISGIDIFDWYNSRFQIEFLFRDAKQYTGLTHGQMRSSEGINFHVNSSMTAVNIMRLQAQKMNFVSQSLASIKRYNFNLSFLKQILCQVGIKPNLLDNKNELLQMCFLGMLVAQAA